jgi:hypothetical protein
MTTQTYKAIYQVEYGILAVGTTDEEVLRQAKSFVSNPLSWGELITISEKVYEFYWRNGNKLNIAKDSDGIFKMCQCGWNGPTFLE